ncbi:MAG: hypothetical protein HUK15_02335 [Bacteroidales bacterium]|nr:hypothetical protein [Bacteroidales bacterium]
MILDKNKPSYDWKFSTIGGVTRVNIETGEDIAHLRELDQKMWTVLSCPVKGLEIDEKTLSLMDNDHDDKIRVNEVLDTVDWLLKVLKDPEMLLKQASSLPLSAINQESEEGLKLYNSAKQILTNLGIEKDEISINDTSDSLAIFAKTKFNGDGIITENSTDDEELKSLIANCISTIGSAKDRSGDDGINADQIESFYASCADYIAWKKDGESRKDDVFPFGENTEAALNAFKAIKDKIDDYFMRCKLVAFDSDSSATLDVSVAKIEEISTKNLTSCIDEISNFPLARIRNNKELMLNEGINPAWEAAFANLRTLVFDVVFAGKASITEAEWNSIGGKFTAYEEWMGAKKGENVESLGFDTIKTIVEHDRKADLLAIVEQDKALETVANEIESVDKLMHLYRDFYKLLKNFVTLSDFYSRDQDTKAVFQAGTLFIDQRSCELCIKVSDMAKHNTMASFSGMFLVYCDCFSKQKNETMTIAAVVTNGDISDIMVGKNAVFYDRNGLDWDAVVTKIIDNPISIRQAFWSPYRKFGRFVEEKINQLAASKDSKMTEDATNTFGAAGDQMIANASKAVQNAPGTDKTKTQAFDIAKFCGIFAAIGMALGYIGAFLVSLVTGFLDLKWWQMPLALIGVMLIISGPSMIMAWLKLRKRNLSPVLNANGWAINAQAYVNIQFGATLTKLANFPKLAVMSDPFAKKGTPVWKKIIYVVLLLGVIFGVLYFTNVLSHVGLPFKKEEPKTEIVAPTDSLPASNDSIALPEVPAEPAETPVE